MTVAAGATLGGSGAVTGLVTVAGIHSPGNSPGNPTYTQLAYDAGAVVQWELADNSGADPGVDFDQIDVSSGLAFNGLTLLRLRFDLEGSAVDWSDEFWDISRSWIVFDLAPGASISGFSNLQIDVEDWADAQGDLLSGVRRDHFFGLSVVGDDIVLTYAIPEPSTYGLALGGLALAAAALRRRRKAASA